MGNDSELNIVVRAKNEASRVLGGIKDDVEGIGGGIKNAFQSAVGPSTALLSGVTAAAAGVGAFGFASVKAFNEAELASAQLGAVLKSTGNAAGVTKDQLLEQATALQSVSMFSDEAVQATQAMLLTFTNIKGGVMKDATETALDLAQAMGMDGKQAAMQLGKALNDPAEGLSKLTRIGVTFTAEQEKQVKALSEAGDTAGAQAVILKELQKEFGGSAKAAGSTFAGQLEILKNTFGDLMEGVGQFIIGALKPVTKALGDWVARVQEAGGFMEYFKNLWEQNHTIIVMVASAIAIALVPALVAAAAAFVSFFAPILPFLAVGAALGLLLDQLAQKLGGWGALFSAGQQAVLTVYHALYDFFMPSLTALWNTISQNLLPALQRFWEVAGPILTPVLKLLAMAIGGTLLAGLWLAINVLNIIIHTFSLLVGWISNVIGWLRTFAGFIGDVFAGIKPRLAGALNGIGDIFTNPFKFAFNMVAKMWNNTVGSLSFKAPDWVPGIGGKGWTLPKIPEFANGVRDFAGGMALVGERGPELVNLPRGASVFSNKESQAMAGSQVTTNVYGPVNLNSADAVKEFMGQLDRNSQLAQLGVPT